MTEIKAAGKFLITGEYLVLKGCKALALPLKRGQVLKIKSNSSPILTWKSIAENSAWFEASIDINHLSVIHSNNQEIANTLVKILQVARGLNPGFLKMGADAEIHADFNLSWGLGSSSTLIYTIAKWSATNPYELLKETFGGSGYDIACAGADGPITYQIINEEPVAHRVDFKPTFTQHIFFVYLGKKMNSRTGMSYFRENAKYNSMQIEKINKITEAIIECKTLDEFESLLEVHETIMSEILQTPALKNSTFSDYPHVIKSMGAWGGDFILVTGENKQQVSDYFSAKGLDVVIPYSDIVLS